MMSSHSFDPNRAGAHTLKGAPSGVDARLILNLHERLNGQALIHVALDDMRASLLEDLFGFFNPHVKVISLPAWDCLPYDRVSPHNDITALRLSALREIMEPSKRPVIILTTVNSLLQRTLPKEILRTGSLALKTGMLQSRDELTHYLVMNGYHPASTVRETGEFAIRGGLMNLFPTGAEAPIRLDFYGDEIESIRVFDPATQTSTSKIGEIVLGPISEVILSETSIAHFRQSYRELFGAVTDNDPLYEAVSTGRKFQGIEHWLGLFYPKLSTVFDYASNVAVSFDYQAAEAIHSRHQQITDFYEARRSLYQAAKRSREKTSASILYKPAPIESLYITQSELDTFVKSRLTITLDPFSALEGTSLDTYPHLDGEGKKGHDFSEARQTRKETDLYEAVKTYIKGHHAQQRHVIVSCLSQGSLERMETIFKAHEIHTTRDVVNWISFKNSDRARTGLTVLGLDHGFITSDLVLITEQDILGDRLTRPSKKKKLSKQFQLELGTLNPGDFVVHADYGIGRYEGLETITVFTTSHDCIKLIYDGGDKLFVPVENIDVLSRYATAEQGAQLDSLGGTAWQQRKSRVKKRLKDLAEALIKIAAQREIKKGAQILIDEISYQEFAARFPYMETEDQAKAILEVFEDLMSGKPMDRLICGDVGFGKTEVALRASFAAVSAGLQVAVVVPTTLLARQHYHNFIQRFSGFPVRIGQLSRMVPSQECKTTKQDIQSGAINILVGTHALLANDIHFKDLGLLIIDEEQHFGVKQKERLKELKSEVHVLTLTATPIPRTLQLSLVGIRELSLITTPPLDRLAVRTFVLPFDHLVIRDALMREHYRGGQSFYVCPRIEDLTSLSLELKKLVPELKLVIAHGRMSATQLDDIMTAFDGKQYDVLLATNIIESGLDIPNANTMIIHRADMFGLAQLYQLRGRVGRAKLRGYTYLTYPSQSLLSKTAQQRLEVIESLDQLGAGFQLATHDMDLRGTGNLLGEEQSGVIKEVGVELYQQMLEDAVKDARSLEGTQDPTPDHWSPTINLGLSVLIPETYVSDLNIRLQLYKRLASIDDENEIEAIAAEMIDRFGPLPEEAKNLLATVSIKRLCRRVGIEKVEAGPKGAVLSVYQNKFAQPEKLISWLNRQSGTAKVRPDQKIVLLRSWEDADERLIGVKKTLSQLAELLTFNGLAA